MQPRVQAFQVSRVLIVEIGHGITVKRADKQATEK